MTSLEVQLILKDINEMLEFLKDDAESKISNIIIKIILWNKFNDVKDSFDRLKFQLNEKIKKCEKLLDEKDKLINPTTGKDIHHKKVLEKKIGELLNDLNNDMNNLSIELKAQKKKKKLYHNLRTKGEILELLKKKIQYMQNRYDNVEINEEEEQNNNTELQKLEIYLEQRKNNKSNYVDRELYDEEKQKMDDWENRIQRQDQGLDEVHQGVKSLKYELALAEEGIDNIQKKVKKTTKKVGKSHKKVTTQTQRIKDLTQKLRSSDKLCCDIILIFILLGLIGVLVAIIRQRY